MMDQQAKFNEFLEQHPEAEKSFFQRPHWTRREFFEVVGAGVVGSFLAQRANADVLTKNWGSVTPNGKAQNVIFILLTGAPSHVDTFDLKVLNGVTPSAFAPDVVNGLAWPTGLLPKIGQSLGDLAIVRSVQSKALVHSLCQTWVQIGRNPAQALGNIAPNIGSVIALEKEKERKPGQVFPTFLALNSDAAAGPGYFSSTYAPFKVTPSASGLRNTTNPDGQARLESKWNLLHSLDDGLRVNSPYGKPLEDMDAFYAAAKGMTYNPVVNQAFSYSMTDSARYGNSSFGNACLLAKQVLQANQGTRFIQVSFGSWDMHVDIYGTANPKGNNLFTMGKALDDGFSALIADLKSSGLLDSTLVVMMGEFGRTTGKLTPAGGRDHWMQQFAVFAGAGIQGGRALGATDAQGYDTIDYGWSQNRYVRNEDIEATIYSAMGIDWTTVRYDDPFKRGFEYVPSPDTAGVEYAPINELWKS